MTERAAPKRDPRPIFWTDAKFRAVGYWFLFVGANAVPLDITYHRMLVALAAIPLWWETWKMACIGDRAIKKLKELGHHAD